MICAFYGAYTKFLKLGVAQFACRVAPDLQLDRIRDAIAGSMLIANARHAQPLRDQTRRELVYRTLQFQKRSQLFVCVHNESPPIALCEQQHRSAF